MSIRFDPHQAPATPSTVPVRSSRKSAIGRLVALILPISALIACGSVSTTTASSAASPKVTSPSSPQALASVVQATARTLMLTSQFEMTFRQSSGSLSATPVGAHGAVDFRGPSATIHIQFARGSGAESMVFRPGTVFFKPPPSTPPLQTGRPWVFANFADIAKYKVNFPPYIVQTESINPALTIYELAWGATSASSERHVSFMGRQASTYVVRVGLQKALAGASGADGDVFSRTLSSEISASGEASPTVTIEAWVDSEGRLIGARVTPVGAGIGTLTIALDRFGASVHADPPPRASVVDLAAMIPGGEQEALNGGDTDGA